MRLIRELSDEDITSKLFNYEDIRFRLRKSSRAVVRNAEKQIALLHVTKDGYHKLPGGGIEVNEDEISAVKREVMEETGAAIEIVDEVGMILEYHMERSFMQISYCYLADAVGAVQEPNLTKDERSKGFQQQWVAIDEAVRLMESDQPHSDSGRFMLERDLTFIRAAQEILS